MSTKREYERAPLNTPNHNNDPPSKLYEAQCENNAVHMGILTDRDFVFIRPHPDELEPREDEHVWLFVPARTSKRSIERLTEAVGSRLVRFYVTVRCLSKYIFSDRDVVYHLNADGQYYVFPSSGLFRDLQVRIVTPERNPEVLECVRAHLVGPLYAPAVVPDASHSTGASQARA